MDVIKDHLYAYYISGKQNDGWDEADAQESSHMILQVVEEYQSSPSFCNWRATTNDKL